MRGLLCALLLISPAVRAAETCEYQGVGDYDARIALTTIAERRGDALQLRVLWRLSARAMVFFRFEYLVEEISEWRGERLERVALNIRHFTNGAIRRQQWDVFERQGDAFEAWRLQGKRQADLAQKHPGFARHWDPAAFGRPWLADYRAGGPEPRSDLSLKPGEAPPSLVPPFAAGFYLPRTAPVGAQQVALFIPGNKQQNRADIPVPPPERGPDGGRTWRIALESQKLGIDRGSIAFATVASDKRLEAVRFHLRGYGTSADGEIRLQGCSGAS